MSVKFINAEQAAAMIDDRATVGIDGFIGFCLAEDILGEIENRFVREGHPKDLSIVNVAGLGGDGERRGINHFAHKGLIRRLLCSNLSLAPKLYPLIMDNAFPTFMIPQGVLSSMMRQIAAHKPGVITKVGMKTFVDPHVDGARVNDVAKAATDDHVVENLTLAGEDYLFYPAFGLDVALIKGSFADEDGNISIEKEAIHIEQLEMAVAAKNTGGIVMVQVDKVVPRGSIHPQKVTVPGKFIDYVIEGKPENTGQHFIGDCKPVPSWCGDEVIPFDDIKPMPFDIKKVICRRGCMEIANGDFINLGIGVPMGVSEVLNEEEKISLISLSIESGVTGGVPAPGLATGAAYNPVAILKQPDIFDIYDGGGIDFTGVGAAEIDCHGNVNVSKFAGNVTGPGGFINITQGAKTLCFMGTFTAGHPQIEIADGKLKIIKEGKYKKFKNTVEQITFSGHYSNERGQKVFFITERAVFLLTGDGLMLIEIAPGIDLEKDILAQMEFKPLISPDLKEMDARLFRPEKMNLKLK
ncbi:MAG: acyl CoA:acetate/3-ketoacid CoA transferase [Anaerovoracaceae bacterium]|jgi:propionate CoA-transferase